MWYATACSHTEKCKPLMKKPDDTVH